MVRYRDLVTVPVADTGESFTTLKQTDVPNGYIPPMVNTEPILKENIIVRLSVKNKLINAQKILCGKNPELSLYITYGYRSLSVQTSRFLAKLLDITKTGFFPDPMGLYEEVHRYIAVPTVAGHPTGGAVDIAIKNMATGRFLDFGSRMYDYSTKDCYVYAPVSKRARENRKLLRQVMMLAGFAPFDGEWWHFSYGDREWAYYYKKPNALYKQVSARQVKASLAFTNRI